MAETAFSKFDDGGIVAEAGSQYTSNINMAQVEMLRRTKDSLIDIKGQLGELNNNLMNFNKSSGKLTKALNKITVWGVFIAAAAFIAQVIIRI